MATALSCRYPRASCRACASLTSPIETISAKDAAQALMRHVLFFAHEPELVERVFDSVLEFVSRVNVRKLVFTPDERAWSVIG